jgi:hypothetical protein
LIEEKTYELLGAGAPSPRRESSDRGEDWTSPVPVPVVLPDMEDDEDEEELVTSL